MVNVFPAYSFIPIIPLDGSFSFENSMSKFLHLQGRVGKQRLLYFETLIYTPNCKISPPSNILPSSVQQLHVLAIITCLILEEIYLFA